jgi:NAD(P)-dependent dehydrogenase (short-subunit alcohol dehydrogenase family)
MGILSGKSGIVTGAAQGFGRATAERMCEEGARVALVDVQINQVIAAADELRAKGYDVLPIVADVSDETYTGHMIREAHDAFGRLDFIHQNAAIQIEKLLHETTPDEWDRVMAVNLRSMYLGARAIIPVMLAQGGGAIVNSASVLSMTADEILPAYVASKHGVLGLTRAIAVTKAYARGGIRCNCICPGDIQTPMVERYWAASRDPAKARADTEAHYPMQRIGSPREMADAVCFLASDLSSFVNGAALTVDGGVTAKVY